MPLRNDLRNLAIVAHVDHGKTTLVDALFRQGGMFRDNQVVAERLMDSLDQERERGITILAKTTSVTYGAVTLQIVDTPGHSDFGGEVERSLRMVDGILLLVDAAEGPLPQTRFVLRKALELHLPVVVAINKIDRSDARCEEVVDEVYDLFIELGAQDHQIEFPILYTNAREGTATTDLNVPGTDLRPLVAAVVSTVPAPNDRSAEPFSLQVNQITYDDYVGRLVIGAVLSGTLQSNQIVHVEGVGRSYDARITGVFRFYGVMRKNLDKAVSGDIVALAGIDQVAIGDVISLPESPVSLPTIDVDEPTVAIAFCVNDGPLAGRSGGVYLTSRHLRERLMREGYANVSIRVEAGEGPDQFRVLGRGELQLAVIIETLRREGFELCVRNPEVITRQREGKREEPLERLVVDIPIQHLGALSELLGSRRAQLLDQRHEGERLRLEYRIPTRGLFGLRGQLMTATRGTALATSLFEKWTEWTGPILRRVNGAIIADRTGVATPYAIFHLQSRGVLFIGAGTQVYEGMIIGENARRTDLNVNICKEKKLTNIRAAGKDENVILTPPRIMTLEKSLEWIKDDEMVEVTPQAIRLRKRVLAANRRPVRPNEDNA